LTQSNCGDSTHNVRYDNGTDVIGSTLACADMNNGYWTNGNTKNWGTSTGWINHTLANESVNKQGDTDIRLVPGWSDCTSAKSKNYWNWRTSEYSGSSTDPKLIIKYTEPNSPQITWEDPTPSDQETIDVDSVYLNTTITDDTDTSAFFDWNKSLIGYWSFEEYNGSGVFDNSTYSHFAIFDGNLSTDSITEGKYGNSIDHDGNMNNSLIVLDTDTLDKPIEEGEITIEAWAKLYTPTSWAMIAIKGNEEHNPRSYSFGTTSTGYPHFAFYNGGWKSFTDTQIEILNDDTWHHIAVTYDKENVQFYVDGIARDSFSETSDMVSDSYDLTIGANSIGQWPWNGPIDEVRIHARSLSPEEINASYNNGNYRLYSNFTNLTDGSYEYSAYAIDESGNLARDGRTVEVDADPYPSIQFVPPTPDNGTSQNETSVYVNYTTNNAGSSFIDFNKSLVGWWTFNNNNSDDSSTYGSGGVVTGAEWISEGKIGGAYVFDGISGNDKIEIPHSDELNPTKELTIMAWVKPASNNFTSNNFTSNNTWSRIVSKSSTSVGPYDLAPNSNGYVELQVINESGGVFYVDTATQQWDKDTWYHITGIVDKDKELRIYVNGEQSGDIVTMSGDIKFDNTKNICIGNRCNSNRPFNGTIDEVLIFNRGLSDEEIIAHYNATLTYHNFTNLTGGNYIFKAHSQNSLGNINSTEERTVTIESLEVANETQGRLAIEEGINNILTGIILTDEQIYIGYISDSSELGVFDKIISYGDQTWAFNYVTDGESSTNIGSLKNIVNTWEHSDLTYEEIVSQVEIFINSTKI
jgi:hypothetical protein